VLDERDARNAEMLPFWVIVITVALLALGLASL
jgi:hypothetical protein